MNSILYKFVFVCLGLIIACKGSQQLNQNQEEPGRMTFLALGDSYTIGEAVEYNKNWPNLLVSHLEKSGYAFAEPTIIAQTGWRTDELLTAINKHDAKFKQYDMVSILIGVNNQYQHKNISQYKEELPKIIKEAIKLSKKGKEGVFAFSIPDYSVTPMMRGKDLDQIASEIAMYNSLFEQYCKEFDIKFYNITDISQQASANSLLIADDKLHPSSMMYELWVKKWSSSIINDIIQ